MMEDNSVNSVGVALFRIYTGTKYLEKGAKVVIQYLFNSLYRLKCTSTFLII